MAISTKFYVVASRGWSSWARKRLTGRLSLRQQYVRRAPTPLASGEFAKTASNDKTLSEFDNE